MEKFRRIWNHKLEIGVSTKKEVLTDEENKTRNTIA